MVDHEPVYDKEIAPLMEQIIGICKRDGIPFVASFWLHEKNGEDPLFCSSSLNVTKEHGALHGALRVLLGQAVTRGFAIRVEDAEGKTTRIEHHYP